MSKQMNEVEKKEFKEFVAAANELSDEDKKSLKIFIHGMLAAKKGSVRVLS